MTRIYDSYRRNGDRHYLRRFFTLTPLLLIGWLAVEGIRYLAHALLQGGHVIW